ncbi:MAG: BON domain-containing protein [Desulfovibrionales bacterium]
MQEDSRIRREILDLLKWDGRIDSTNIDVQVENGTVTLLGTVPALVGLNIANSDAWFVSGVKDVANLIKVDKLIGRALQDREIQDRIEQLLAWSAVLDSRHIRVFVQDGMVFLEGTIRSLPEKMHAQELISGMSGVSRVENRIGIAPREDVLDHELAERLQKNMHGNQLVGSKNISVTVDKGRVVLEGETESWEDRRRAEEAASYTRGVTTVENRIVVRKASVQACPVT